MPGTLVLQNLQDNRKIRMDVGQEDSEILWAGNDKVIYRVNGTIYDANYRQADSGYKSPSER